LEKNQPRLIDLTLNITPPEILQHPPFFTGQHLKITACNKKTTEKRKNPTTSTGSSTGRSKTPTAKRLGDKNTLALTARGKHQHQEGETWSLPPPANGAHRVLSLSRNFKPSLSRKKRPTLNQAMLKAKNGDKQPQVPNATYDNGTTSRTTIGHSFHDDHNFGEAAPTRTLGLDFPWFDGGDPEGWCY